MIVSVGRRAVQLHQVQDLDVQVEQVVLDPGGKVSAAVAFNRLLRQTPAYLGGDDDVFFAGLLQLPDQAMTAAISVDIGGVEKVDTRVDRLVEGSQRFLVGYLAPGPAN